MWNLKSNIIKCDIFNNKGKLSSPLHTQKKKANDHKWHDMLHVSYEVETYKIRFWKKKSST